MTDKIRSRLRLILTSEIRRIFPTEPSVNCLGLSPKDGPLSCSSWPTIALRTCEERRKVEMDMFHVPQLCGDPIAEYGEENAKFLKSVSEKYDPEGVFWTFCTGRFKIPR